MKAGGVTYRIVELGEPIDPDFHLEPWLADLLVAYWLSLQGNDGE